MTAADIARLATVRRAAVSNWRRRHADFPAPVGGTAASPEFSLEAVEAWFGKHRRRFEVSDVDRLWHGIRGGVEHIRLAEALSLIGLVLVTEYRKPGSWGELSSAESTLLAAVPEVSADNLPTFDTAWEGIVGTTVDMARSAHPSEVFNALVHRFLESQTYRHPVSADETAALMCTLAGVTADTTVYDPSCGAGSLLYQAHLHGANRLAGAAQSGALGRIALARLLLADASAQVLVAHSLTCESIPRLVADAAIADVPFRDRSWRSASKSNTSRWEFGVPPRSEPELAWVQHCLTHVAPGGRVVVTMPPAAASRPAGRRIRRNLVRAGALLAVVNLPSNRRSTALDLWVLRRPGGHESRSGLLVVASPSDLQTIEDAWTGFCAGEAVVECAAVIPAVDVLDGDVDLTPDRLRLHRAPAYAPDMARMFCRLRDEIEAEASLVPEQLPTLVAAGGQGEAWTTVGALISSGAVTLQQAPIPMSVADGEIPVLSAKDLRENRQPTGRTTDQPGLVPLAAGDVVLAPLSRASAVNVVDRAGAVLGPQLVLLRPEQNRADTHFLAGFLRISQRQASQRGRTTGRFDFRGTAVPDVPLSRQRHYGTVFRQLASLQDQLHRLTKLASELDERALDGIASTTLVPSDTGGIGEEP